ncbi:pilus assembly protein PilP [Methylomarinum sp. Ch1-1]|uniref:Pilus assembly protein PilP n=1 Tax=Methylomarinum roseum TaxID=3067653 RepID=A0AAU7NXT4_9GAMM|nr:pilus assembly protein PilP [Methylomarinum sp. Ch1-1]MDP4522130.1 pilus assembly protein PilP [Methylomarinum sp. Ch1-1]
MKPRSNLMKSGKCVFSLSVFLMINLTGCSDEDFSDLSRYIADVKARPKGAIEPLPEIKVVEPFIFKPDGLRDPFKPVEVAAVAESLDVAEGSGIRPDVNRRKEELESYSLDTLRMVGTVTMDKGLWGLIKARDGTIHRVRVGHHMGKNYGKIVRIQEDKIELMEIVPDSKPGLWREQQASLALAE